MFVECHVRALAVDPRDPRILYLGTELGLFHSTDGADNWSRVESPLNERQIWSILLAPHDPNLMLVGVCPARLYRTEDGGRTWSAAAAEVAQACPRIIHTRVTTIVADPLERDTFWAGVEIDGVRRSQDAGRTWQAIGSGLSSQDIHALAVLRGAAGTRRLLAATNNDVNLSSDNGHTWQPLHVGRSLPWSYCRALAQPINQPEVVLLGNGNGPPGHAGIVARSIDGGDSWEAAQMPGLANSTIWNFAVHPADPKLIYASSVSGEVYRSIDGGISWDKLAREFGEIRALAWTP
jgi:photosystem II stability/assembly factor-like uncharacterized protein